MIALLREKLPNNIILYLIAILSLNNLYAADEMTYLVEGTKLMSEQQYEQALVVFNKAIDANPFNPQPLFFSGACSNRLARGEDALNSLRKAEINYFTERIPPHPDLKFELGWAYLQTNNYRSAIEALDEYEKDHPGRGQTSEFLGRAYLSLGELDKAEHYFMLALERSPELEPTVKIALASIAQRRGNTLKAQSLLSSISAKNIEDPLSNLLRDTLPSIAPTGKPFNFSFGTSYGHSDNAIALGEDQPAGAEVTDESDSFLRIFANLSYTWQPKNWQITTSYYFQNDRYDEIRDVNQQDHIGGLYVSRLINQTSGIGFSSTTRYTYVDDQSFRSEINFTPSYWYRFNSNIIGEISYTYTNTDYLGSDFIPEQDRDNEEHKVTPTAYWNLPDRKLWGNVGTYLATSDADGSDFDYDDFGLFTQANWDLSHDVIARISYTYSHKDFDNKNSLSNFTKRREDDLHYAFINISKTFRQGTQKDGGIVVFGQYEYTDRDSNVGFFAYDQRILSAGLQWVF